jgi:hypothetical protein
MATGRVPTTANSPLTAKGDLFGYSTTQARVPVGNDGETIVADSSTSTGLRYTAGIGITQPIINGSFDVWQRGTTFTSFPSTSTFTADRFYCYGNSLAAGITVSRQATNDTTNLPFIQYAARVARDSGITSTQQINLLMDVETVNSIPFAGKTLTLSFYARKGANYSPTSSLLNYQWRSGTGTDQRMANGYTGSTQIGTDGSVTLTTTWQRFTVTGTMVATATQMGLQLFSNPTGTAGANDWFEITGIQVDVGSTALPIRRSGGTIQGELAACQRYYQRFTGGSSYSFYAYGTAGSTTLAYYLVNLKQTMRVKPTAIEYSNVATQDLVGANIAFSSLVIDNNANGPDFVLLQGNVSSGLTQYRTYSINNNNNTAGYLALSSEL